MSTTTTDLPAATTLTVFAAEVQAHDLLPGFGRVIEPPTRTDDGRIAVKYRPGTSVRRAPRVPVTTRYSPSEQVTVERPTLEVIDAFGLGADVARIVGYFEAQPESEWAETVITDDFLRIVRVSQSLVEAYRGNAFMVQRIDKDGHWRTFGGASKPVAAALRYVMHRDYPAMAAVIEP